MADTFATGTLVAGFRIDSVLGEGGTGIVYRAQDEDGRRLALKLLSPDLAHDERFRRRFLRETEVAASLDHPNVVRTLASGEENGTLYLAMEYIEGSDLRELLRREGRLDPARALDLISDVAGALDAAHAAGLVHRDVKPRNVLVASGQDGERAYVCDFGLARHVSSASSLTGERGFVGTIDYVPPEQIEGGRIDGRADVYSLGCVLFECLTGLRPFERESELSVVFAHLNEPAPRITTLRPELPEAFDAVFETALAKSPADRYSTCGDLAKAARKACQGKVLRRGKTKRRLLLAGAALVAAAGAAAGGLVASETSRAHGAALITLNSIDGAQLGFNAARYEKLFGGWRASELTDVKYSSLAFEQPEVAVYFPPKKKRADIITTWNRNYRTAAGVGPCSTIAQVKRAYGAAVQPSRAGTSPNGKVHWSWVVGNRLLFATQDHKTIADVALYHGSPTEKHPGGPQDYANYVAVVETACK